jgi:hypothetical protein
MTVWFAAALFIAIAVALIAAREPLSRGQALIVGGRMGAGCVIAEAVAFLVMAALVVIFRDLLR